MAATGAIVPRPPGGRPETCEEDEMPALARLRIGALSLVTAVAGSSLACNAASAADPVVETRFYALHSDPWINLHHFLYQWARADLGLGQGRAEVPVPERDGTAPSSPEWSAAVRFYRENVAERDHFDDDMLVLKDELVRLAGDPTATPPDAIDGIAEHLRAAMPIYLRTWWTEHDGANRAWIARVAEDLRRHETRWLETVSELFDGGWLDGRLRVDVSAYANWQGGYTSVRPDHTVVWSRDEDALRGLYALELLFHESGHMTSLGSSLRSTVQEIFREAEVDEPANLRHTLLFATAGELTVMIAEERGLPRHVPYIVDLVGFAGWAPLWPPVVEHWLPAVRGERDHVEALRAIAEALR